MFSSTRIVIAGPQCPQWASLALRRAWPHSRGTRGRRPVGSTGMRRAANRSYHRWPASLRFGELEFACLVCKLGRGKWLDRWRFEDAFPLLYEWAEIESIKTSCSLNMPATAKAIFLDRDGVLNRTDVVNGVPYPPKTVADVEILFGVREACELLRQNGFLLI